MLHLSRRLTLVIFGIAAYGSPGILAAADARHSASPPEVRLSHSRSRQQILVTRHEADGDQYDATREASYESADPAIAGVDRAGVVTPRGAGATVVRITHGTAPVLEVPVVVGDLSRTPAVSFQTDVAAVLGKAGCNAGACHGHNSGRGGLKLSLRGYDPASDFTALARDQTGRRINVLDPDASLLILKPAGIVGHGGDRRFAVGSPFHRVLREWLAEGARSDVGQAARVERISVEPEFRLMPRPELTQQIRVHAHFSDGSVCDVTDQAIYELSAEGVVEVGPDGLVAGRREGEAAVLVRFLGRLGLSRYLVTRRQTDFAWSEPPVQNFVDTLVWTKLRQIQAQPSDLCTDAEFLRRVSFDLTGLPPEAAEVRAFLADADPHKRARKIDELLDRDAFGDFWAVPWLELSGTTESGDSASLKGVWTLSFWLRDALNRNLPYDQFAKALISGEGSALQNPAVTYTTNRLPKVEVVPQLFLGIRLECAQCHDHPFDTWQQADYQALQNFFLGRASKEGPGDPFSRDIRNFIPPEKFLPWELGRTVTLRHLDGTTVAVPVQQNRQAVLAAWMFGPARKQTARALVNRTWGRLFGRGIVEPVDDMRFSNPPVNAPLLDALADDFIARSWDFKQLVRTIAASRTYQLSSITNPTNAREEMNFSHARVRRLSAEQIYDALAQITGVSEELRVAPAGFRSVLIPTQSSGSRFLGMFGRPALRMSPCECIRSPEVTLPQILHLLNGDSLGQRLKSEQGALHRLLAAQPTPAQLIDELYLAVLNRPPTNREMAVAREFFLGADDPRQAAEDLAWILLTSQEFLFNH